MAIEPIPVERPVPRGLTWLIVLSCWIAILSEGYDVGVMGAILPALAVDRHWSLSPMQLGQMGAYALVGMFIGGMLVGTLSDLFGRKKTLIACIALFSLTMIGAALAPTPAWFALFRVAGGFGLGGVIPVAAALTIEYSPVQRRSRNYGLMYSGYSLGIAAAGLVAHALLASHGWRTVVGFGGVALVVVPVLCLILPESLDYLVASGQDQRARSLAVRLGMPVPVLAAKGSEDAPHAGWRAVLSTMFVAGSRRATACFWISLFCGMLLVYGLNTWLPQIMRKAGFDLGSSLLFLIFFSLSSAIGGVVLGRVADHFGAKWVVAIAFAVGGLAIFGLAFSPSLLARYIMVMLAGIGTISASLVLTGFLGSYYPAHARGAVIGWALSFARIGAMVGPLLGGYVATLGLSFRWHFGVFAIAALIAAIAVVLIPQPRRLPLAAKSRSPIISQPS